MWWIILLIALLLVVLISSNKNNQEKMTFSQPLNTTYWPQYFFTIPYDYNYSGAWPPGMFSRLYNWEPGFSSGTGWSFYMRPGMEYKAWPRNRWVRQNGDYYFVNNLFDRSHDYYGVS